jgi:biotin transport system substrate-specific component
MQMPIALTLARRISPSRAIRSSLVDVLLVISGSLIVAALAQVRIPLPFTPVPLTGQTLGVLLVAAVLGRTRGAASLILYLLEGLLGLPVFAGGPLGLARLLGPTGGYLLGFIAAAFLVGYLAERGFDRDWKRVSLMYVAGMAVIYLFGLLWLAHFTALSNALIAGLWPFLPGDLLKALCAALLLPLARTLVDRFAA